MVIVGVHCAPADAGRCSRRRLPHGRRGYGVEHRLVDFKRRRVVDERRGCVSAGASMR
jgi:hypothetical protein